MHNLTSPDLSDKGVEALIQARGKTAPRITPADIEGNISSEHYFTARQAMLSPSEDIIQVWADIEECGKEVVPFSLLTFCILVLRNGFTVTGESACASPENFDAGIGRKIARTNAVLKIWPLMGYQLKQELHLADKKDTA